MNGIGRSCTGNELHKNEWDSEGVVSVWIELSINNEEVESDGCSWAACIKIFVKNAEYIPLYISRS